MGVFFGLVGMLGFIFSLILLVVIAIKKKPKKKVGIALGVFFSMFILGIVLTPTNNSDAIEPTVEPVNASQVAEIDKNTEANEEKVVLSLSEKELLKKSYADFNVSQRLHFIEIDNKYNELSDNEKQAVKVDFERLSQERDIQMAKEAEEEAAIAAAKEAEEAAAIVAAKEAEETTIKSKESSLAVEPAAVPVTETNKNTGNPEIGNMQETDKNVTGYTASSISDKFHYPPCRYSKKIADENLIVFETVQDAINNGYSPCGVCNPR